MEVLPHLPEVNHGTDEIGIVAEAALPEPGKHNIRMPGQGHFLHLRFDLGKEFFPLGDSAPDQDDLGITDRLQVQTAGCRGPVKPGPDLLKNRFRAGGLRMTNAFWQ